MLPLNTHIDRSVWGDRSAFSLDSYMKSGVWGYMSGGSMNNESEEIYFIYLVF